MQVPYGECHCGCGEKTKIAPYDNPKCGVLKGEPYRYRIGHHRRKGPDDYLVDENGCWLWQRSITNKGYGQLRRNGVLHRAHRWYWVEARGPVPEGLELDHLCHVRHCVNPDHLEAVTHAENIRRRRPR